ncbi:MAG: methylenetetrahydrofolate--tRNA-(uracil(54)-C(5))-methyltransferase (FADH(2)-oxidizing) TrmFO [Rickettsiales bacterium]|nr:methylenetetrahydrofolate--tRNA-(uracil(54)-C(5))-methyltransferase (FADH(2)-oxidizing) TrmFO [Rickettsiales bacterium]
MTVINIIGAGLAGSEAAWQLAKRGFKIKIYEQRNKDKKTFAHQTDNFAELVCSNSLRCDDVKTAIGLLHEEMRKLDSLIIKSADINKVPAGSALAVDRDGFSHFIKGELLKTGNVEVIRQEIKSLPVDSNEKWIIATGPLTSDNLSHSIKEISGEDKLAFFDAIAPIVHKESINFDIAWFQSRYDKQTDGGDGKDYINCPLTKDQYYEFVDDLLESQKTEFKDWEKDTPYFNGCLPIEEMARRGKDTLRFGPLKPVGLTNPRDPKNKPHAIIQLRQDNKLGTLYNLVGFQTKMKYGEQKRVFQKIPGLENVEFARLGGIHRNTFINSPKLLDKYLRLKTHKNIQFAGQITGVEGYVESAAMGLLAGIFASNEETRELNNKTAIGSLLNHITKNHDENSDFQPMNVNYGLFDPLEEKMKKADRKGAYSKRALEELDVWIAS